MTATNASSESGPQLTLSELELDTIKRALYEISNIASSVHHLAMDATEREDARYLTAIEAMAKTQALKCDVALSYLGDLGVGMFDEEFQRKSTARK